MFIYLDEMLNNFDDISQNYVGFLKLGLHYIYSLFGGTDRYKRCKTFFAYKCVYLSVSVSLSTFIYTYLSNCMCRHLGKCIYI